MIEEEYAPEGPAGLRFQRHQPKVNGTAYHDSIVENGVNGQGKSDRIEGAVNGDAEIQDHSSQGELDDIRKENLVFIPYYARANRGGKGMMRVGIRTCE